MFENAKLLRDVAKSDTPTMIGCMKTGAGGIHVDDEGTFRDLGAVGVAVGATCNILSACQMADTGMPYCYDIAKNEYAMVGTDIDYVFTRLLRDDGYK